MLAEPRAHPRARHGVPLVADAAGVQPQRPRRRGLGAQRRNFRRDEAGLEIVGEESAFGEEARLRLAALPDRPLHRRHRVEIAVRQRLPARRCRSRARPRSRMPRARRAREKYPPPKLKPNAAPKPSRLATSPMIHQSGLRLAGRGKERALPRDAPLRIGHGAGFLAPGLRRQQHMRAGVDRVVGNHVLGNDEQFELLQRLANAVGVRQRHRRIGAHHPQRLDLAARDRLEHLDRLQPLMGGDARRLPEPAHAVDVRRRKSHMGGELVGEPADLAAAHRIGLPGQRERRCARPCRSARSRGGN